MSSYLVSPCSWFFCHFFSRYNNTALDALFLLQILCSCSRFSIPALGVQYYWSRSSIPDLDSVFLLQIQCSCSGFRFPVPDPVVLHRVSVFLLRVLYSCLGFSIPTPDPVCLLWIQLPCHQMHTIRWIGDLLIFIIIFQIIKLKYHKYFIVHFKSFSNLIHLLNS